MPVTARLLQRLHETLGDEATNDLFAWWEEAATVNRLAVREVADLYYARFGELLGKGLAELRGELTARVAELRSEFKKEMVELRGESQKEMAELQSEFKQETAELRADLIKWMFLFWAGTVIPLAGLMVALLKL